MQLLLQIIFIIIAIIVQAIYDYLGWCVWLKENPNRIWKEIFFRVIKFVVDYPVFYFLIFKEWLVLDFFVIFWFYILKQSGWCDMVYILIWKIFHLDKEYIVDEYDKNLWWLWWTIPFGILATVIQSIQNKKIIKGRISYIEFKVGLFLSIISFFIWVLFF